MEVSMLHNHFQSRHRVSGIVLGIVLGLAQSLAVNAPAAESGAGGGLRTAIAVVAKQTIPAVAHIEVTQRQEINNPLLPFENDPFFHYFFNVPRKMPKKFKRELKGLGSGMVMDPEGHILTNNHVVAGASEIDVQLADGSRYKAKVVGTDPKTDLAVIKIKADESLPYVQFGDSDKMEVGDWVVAIGHPRGLDQTVTQGIISAKHRQGILDPSSYQDYLQTDAAINPGNSGGPLLNLDGQVIGVNAAIFSESGGFEGIGFAIPSNMAVYIAKTLIAHGKVERGWLGVNIQELTPELAKAMRLESSKGALIADVVKGGPADRAGIQKGDVVTAYDGKEVANGSDLQNAVARATIGQDSMLSILRNGKPIEISVKVDSLENAIKKMAVSLKDRLGVIVRTVTDKEIQKYGLEEAQGVVIVSLQPGGSLAKAGFEVGDIILAIDDQPVKDEQAFLSLLEVLKPRQVVQIMALDHNSGQTGYVKVRVR